MATLLATNGVTLPSGAQTYGALIAGGGAVTQAFSFTAVGGCGSNIIAALALTDNGTNLGNVTLTIPLGQLGPIYAQNFDGVTAPALPPGWTTSAGGGQSAWVTTGSLSDTAPNAVFSPDPGTTGSNELVSQTFPLPPGVSQLSFRHRYELESGFDGGVLEIKIGAGAFTDILSAGGSFASGGYVQALSSGNALGARQAWTGTNATFSTVVVNLPASAASQVVQFRWRCGTDSSVSRAGWWIDSVAINGALCCGGAFPPVITTQPQSQTVSQGSAAGFSVSAIGQNPLSYQWYFNSNSIASATNNSYTLGSATTNDAGGYFVIVTNASGSATSSVATLSVRVSPLILTNPASLTVVTGGTAGFSVTALGAAPLSYQWQFGGADISGATNNSYARTNVQLADAGNYTVIITNFAGSVTSAPAVLTVVSGTATSVVISQIYGGGGNSGATYRNDYVELFNPGTASVNVSAWSVQYASASGTGWSVINLNGSVAPGQYYLVQLGSGGSTGALLPVASATNSLNISGVNGKLALVTNQTALTGSSPVGGVTIRDFVGYGTANAFEGAAAAPAGGNAAAIFRKNNGLTDTGDNAADFQTGTPNPRMSATNAPPASSIDLAITKTHTGNFTQGEASQNYTILVTNVGSLATTSAVSVVDVLPAGLTATAMTGTGWTITFGTLTATRADALNTNTAYPAITLTVSVATNAPASVTNSATVSTGGDANSANNTANDLTSIIATNTGGGGSFTGVLAGWDVSAQTSYGVSPFTATTNAANVAVVGLTRGSGVGTSGTAASGGAWGGNGFDSASAAAAVTANDFVTCGVTASAGIKVSFSSISRFDYRRSGSGPPSGVMQYQIGSGAFVSFATNSYSSTSSSGASLAAIDLTGIAALQTIGPGTNVTFRIVNFGASAATGTWYIYNVVSGTAPDFSISGTVAPLAGPPPAAPALTLLNLVSNQFQFTLTGTAGSNYVIEISTNLAANRWTPVQTGAAPVLFTEPATNDQRFYRGKILP